MYKDQDLFSSFINYIDAYLVETFKYFLNNNIEDILKRTRLICFVFKSLNLIKTDILE